MAGERSHVKKVCCEVRFLFHMTASSEEAIFLSLLLFFLLLKVFLGCVCVSVMSGLEL